MKYFLIDVENFDIRVLNSEEEVIRELDNIAEGEPVSSIPAEEIIHYQGEKFFILIRGEELEIETNVIYSIKQNFTSGGNDGTSEGD